MKLITEILEEKVRLAMEQASGSENCEAIVKPSADAKFGDYQANGVMGLQKN